MSIIGRDDMVAYLDRLEHEASCKAQIEREKYADAYAAKMVELMEHPCNWKRRYTGDNMWLLKYEYANPTPQYAVENLRAYLDPLGYSVDCACGVTTILA